MPSLADVPSVVEAQGTVAIPCLPARSSGVRILGEFTGSGLRDRVFLVRRADGQVIALTELLATVLDTIDGCRDTATIAQRVRTVSGRPVSPTNIEHLLATKLIPLGLIEDGGPSSPPRATPVLGLTGRRTLVPPRGVGVLARAFAPMFRPVVVTIALVALVLVDVRLAVSFDADAAMENVLASPDLILALLGLTVLSMLFHECGHAAACHYGGGRPGVIGYGIYLLWPAFYTDVTDVYRLSRSARLRTDLGGVYFNALLIVGLGAVHAVSGLEMLGVAALVVHVEALRQLVPVVRLDGYHILSDLAGVPDLFARMGPVLSNWLRQQRARLWRSAGEPADPRVTVLTTKARRMITTWVLIVVPILIANLVLVIVLTPSMLVRIAEAVRLQATLVADGARAGELTTMVLAGMGTLLVALPAVGLAFLFWRLAGVAGRTAVVLGRGHPARAVSMATGGAAVAVAIVACWWWRGIR